MTMRAAMVCKKEIPHDVATEILERLPVKSLLRFKCVCKDWYSLIISPYFVEKHYDTNKTKQTIFYNSTNPTVRIFGATADYTIPSGIQYRGIIGCSKGVVCLSLSVGNYTVTALWNPGTRQFREIGHPYGNQDLRTFSNGFCFDNVEDAFKVSQIAFSRRQDRIIAQVCTFNLNDNYWKKRTKETGCPSSEFSGWSCYEVVCVDRCMYWIISYHNGIGESVNNFILCYDMVNEVFQVIESPCPDFPTAMWTHSYLGRYKNTVAFIKVSEFYPYCSFQVWVMDGYVSVNLSWSKPLTYRALGVENIVKVVGFFSNSDEDNLVVMTKDGNYWLCNPTVECIGQSHLHTGIFQYSESLASIDWSG